MTVQFKFIFGRVQSITQNSAVIKDEERNECIELKLDGKEARAAVEMAQKIKEPLYFAYMDDFSLAIIMEQETFDQMKSGAGNKSPRRS